MDIRPIVIGTAGHIDHGKSSLVRALTGIDPDRLKEEKERGLTIDLGFAPLELPDGRTVGIVDVPGHERFIRNMVAGASGIDLVVLVVAADDGVMPQTREHVQIMGLLGVKTGFVALNKIDMVDAELVDLAEEDVRSELAGTFLADAPIVRVSAVTKEGLDALRATLFALCDGVEPRSAAGVFRLPIQRVFSSRGFGTVLTGIPLSGSIDVGETIEVLPGGQRSKVRGIHAYGRVTQSARAGHSSALNVPDIDHHAVRRGHVVARPGFFSTVRMVGARLSVLPSLDRPVSNRMSVRLHVGTADPLGEVVILDREDLPPGESGLVQLRLSEPLVCAPGDPFVLRLASPAVTLGGGVILEESRFRLKRFKDFVLSELQHQEESLSDPGTLVEAILARAGNEFVATADLARAIKREEKETAGLLGALEAQGSVRNLAPNGAVQPGRWMHVDRLEALVLRVAQVVHAWFQENPHRRVVEVIELRRRTKLEPQLLGALLEEQARRGELVLESGGIVALRGRAVELDDEQRARRDRVLAALEEAAFQPPSPPELAAALGLSAKDLARTLELLVDEGSAVLVQKDLYLAAGPMQRAREAIVANCERNGPLAIPELRDALGTTRKFLIPLLEYFDTAGLTLRQAGHRILKRT